MGGERGGGSGGGGCWRNTRERAGGEERSGAWAARSEVASADQHQQDQSIIIGRFGDDGSQESGSGSGRGNGAGGGVAAKCPAGSAGGHLSRRRSVCAGPVAGRSDSQRRRAGSGGGENVAETFQFRAGGRVGSAGVCRRRVWSDVSGFLWAEGIEGAQEGLARRPAGRFCGAGEGG